MQFEGGFFDFQWSFDEVRDLARRAGEDRTIVGSSVMFFVNATDWYTSLNRTGWASTTVFDSRVKLHLIGNSVRSFKPLSEFNVQVKHESLLLWYKKVDIRTVYLKIAAYLSGCLL